MEINLEADLLEKEIQKVFKKLPNICCDVNSHLFIIQVLSDAFKNLTGRNISLNY